VPDPAPADRAASFTAESVPDEYERHLARSVFEPWAERLLDTVALPPGARVLDVASGTGVVARAAARRSGPTGSVLATDVSDAMLARSAASGRPPAAAPIEYRRASADALPFADASFDAVLCQQGLQFFASPGTAVGQMRRVLRSGGTVGIAVWAAGYPVEPFGVYGDELAAVGATPPFPGAFDSATFTMAPELVGELLESAGLAAVDVRVTELEVSWSGSDQVAAGVMGTPFGPLVAMLAPPLRERYMSRLRAVFTPERDGGPVRRRTAAVIARAVVP
jgi:ubiquinone/menaquinone biosynthesis C-methylase UbiE